MAQAGLLFCLSVLFSGSPVLADVSKAWGSQGFRILKSTEQHLSIDALVPEVVRPRTEEGGSPGSPANVQPYYFLPMFQHAEAPLVDIELFRPVAGKRPFPSALTNLLLPTGHDPYPIQVAPVRNPRGVEVWCGYSKISVRVTKGLLGFRSVSTMFHLGTCPVTRSTPNYFYFHYNLNECGSSFTTMYGHIVYSNTLCYTPEQQGEVIRAVPLTLPIQCQYNRFHYSYKVGYVPELHERTFLKRLRSKRLFSLSARNEQWEKLASDEGYVLGEPMYFEAAITSISKDERIFIDACFATTSTDPNSTPRLDVIKNFGCMVDSKRKGSHSQFHSRESNILRFSVDAFLFPKITAEHLYLHCTMSVGKTTAKTTAKSCTYNRTDNRWEELYSPASVCSCCNAKCEVADFWPASLSPAVKSLITSDPWSVVEREQSMSIQAEEGRADKKGDSMEIKFKAAFGSNGEVEKDLQEVEEPGREGKGGNATKDDHVNQKRTAVEKDGTAEPEKALRGEKVVEEKMSEKEVVVVGEMRLPGEVKTKVVDLVGIPGNVTTKTTTHVTGGKTETEKISWKVVESVKVATQEELKDVTGEEADETEQVTMKGLRKNGPVEEMKEVPPRNEEETFLNADQEPAVWKEDDQRQNLKEKK